MKTGVYICHCGLNIAATVDVEEVVKHAKSLPNVVIARDYKYMCSDPGQELIKKDIEEAGLNRVVVASCSPRMHEPTFRKVVEDKKLNPYCFEMANIREQCSWVHEDKENATEKAKKLIAGAVARATELQPLERREVDVIPKALVIGGGIAGIQAALEIAENGIYTYLVERSPSIGGRMAQLDKTFPTLDCSACILTPKMVDVSRHPNIELLSYSEVESVEGYIGNFKVKVKKKPRYIDEEKCIGCGECAKACLLKGKIPNEFDLSLGKRGAAYIPFPQAVPLKYLIDPKRCLYLTRGVCGKKPACKAACLRDAIDFEQQEKSIELEVGAIVVATGFDLFDPSQLPEYGYGKYPEVITGLEFERLSSASGPTNGKIEVNGKEPKRVAFISCVGSRKKETNPYCSRVCCMYTVKHAHLVKEKIPDAEVTIYYTDVRAFGKGYEEFYDRVKAEGVKYKRRELDDEIKVSKKSDRLVVDAKPHEPEEVDLVVLANAIVPRSGVLELARTLNITRGPDGFFLEAHPKLKPVDTFSDGIFLAGCAQSPKDIPDTVAQASGAGAKASIPLAAGKVAIEPIVAIVDEDLCSGCRVCEHLCEFNAFEYDREKRLVRLNEVLCKGCGVCVAACPSKAISMKHYTDVQLSAQLAGLIS